MWTSTLDGETRIAPSPPPPPSQYNMDADSALDGIVMKCLSPRPEDRYADAKGLLKALTAWRSDEAASAKPAPSPASTSHFSKDAFGHATTANQDEAESLARQAIKTAKQGNKLQEAADLMEEAFNKWPSLREKYAQKVLLWRNNIIM